MPSPAGARIQQATELWAISVFIFTPQNWCRPPEAPWESQQVPVAAGPHNQPVVCACTAPHSSWHWIYSPKVLDWCPNTFILGKGQVNIRRNVRAALLIPHAVSSNCTSASHSVVRGEGSVLWPQSGMTHVQLVGSEKCWKIWSPDSGHLKCVLAKWTLNNFTYKMQLYGFFLLSHCLPSSDTEHAWSHFGHMLLWNSLCLEQHIILMASILDSFVLFCFKTRFCLPSTSQVLELKADTIAI